MGDLCRQEASASNPIDVARDLSNAMRHGGRKSVRLRDWDYASSAWYFVTICVHRRKPLFGEIVGEETVLNEFGRIVDEEWALSVKIRKELYLDDHVVMPNHLHGIVILQGADGARRGRSFSPSVGAHGRAPLQRPPRSLGSFIAGFKSRVTTRINQHRLTPRAKVWQRGYYEHIIRDQRDLDRIRRYIRLNPLEWGLDPYHVEP